MGWLNNPANRLILFPLVTVVQTVVIIILGFIAGLFGTETPLRRWSRGRRLLKYFNYISTILVVAASVIALVAYALSHIDAAIKIEIAALALFVGKYLLIGAIQAVGGIAAKRVYDTTQKKKPKSE